MAESTNSGPLGNHPGESSSELKRVKVIGKTKEERKEIARQIRLAAKKEKKKIKADAKKQRKLNAIMHRRATRNVEKYNKNKERNEQRAIDLERQRIRYNAVRQAEHLAAKYDPSGKLFNVGEVVVMPDGQVKSKEVLAKAAEEKIKRDAEKAEEEAYKKAKEKFKEARRAAHAATGMAEPILEEDLNRAFYEQNPRPHKLSRKQQQRQELLRPKPVPPKPVIPAGYSIPAGEEDFLALWDITDQEIKKRLSDAKKNKKLAAKDLRRVQQEAKKFNRAMKVKKKMAANAGILWDPERARREILAQANGPAKDDEKSDSNFESSSDSGSDSDSEAEGGINLNGNDSVSGIATEPDDSGAKSNGNTHKKKKLGKFPGVRLNLDLLAKAERIEKARQQKKKEARDRRRAERKAAAAAEEKAAEEARAAKKAVKKKAKEEEKAAKRKAEEEADIISSKKQKRCGVEEAVETAEIEKKDKTHKKRNVNSEDLNNGPIEDSMLKKKKKHKINPEEETADLLQVVEEQLLGENGIEKKKKKSKSKQDKDGSLEENDVQKKMKKRKFRNANDEDNENGVTSEKVKKKKRRLLEGNDDKLDRITASTETKKQMAAAKDD